MIRNAVDGAGAGLARRTGVNTRYGNQAYSPDVHKGNDAYMAAPGASASELFASRMGFRTSEQSYEDTLRSMYRRQSQDFNQHTLPIIKQLEEEATSNETYMRGMDMAGKLPDKIDSVRRRTQEYSASGLLPSQAKNVATAQSRNVSKAQSSVVTQGWQDQVARHRAARTNLMSVAENLQSTGVAGIAQISAQKNQRDAAYRQQKSGFAGQLGAIAGGTIGFFAGGPAGASAGAAIGGSLGGAVGG